MVPALNVTQAAETTVYDYDALGRVAKVCFVETARLITYNYDAAGNRTSVATTGTSCGTPPPPPNQPPVAVNDTKTASLIVHNKVQVNVLSNDSDPDGDPLTITGASCVSSGCSVSISSNKLNITGTTVGDKVVSYTISDGRGGTDSATVTVKTFNPQPNKPPVAVNDTVTASLIVSNSIQVNALSNDSDPDGDPLTITGASCVSSGCSVSISSNKLNITGTTVGDKVVSYTISDGRGGTDSATVTVKTFNPQPNRPPVAIIDFVPGIHYRFDTVWFDPRVNDSDPDGDPLTITSATCITTSGCFVMLDAGILQIVGVGVGDKAINYTISDGRGGTATASVHITFMLQPGCGQFEICK